MKYKIFIILVSVFLNSYGITIIVTDTIICSSTSEIQLSPTISGATSIKWSTSGDGYFEPFDSLLLATYHPGNMDYIVGNVTLTLTGYCDTCSPVSDDMRITFAFTNPDFELSGSCEKDSILFTDESRITGDSIISYRWISDSATLSFSKSFNYLFDTTGYHLITLHIQSANGCMDSISKPVTLYPKPQANFSSQSICGGIQFIDQSVIHGDNITKWHWNMGNGDTSTLYNPEYIHNDTTLLTNEKLIVSTDNNCTDTSYGTAKALLQPQAGFYYDLDKTRHTTIHLYDSSLSAATSSWIFDYGLEYQGFQYSHTFPYPGYHAVLHKIASKDGCIDTTATIIKIVSPCALPTLFTPNDDNINDKLTLLGGPFLEIDLRIFDKRGRMMYYSNNPEDGWNGSFNGTDQPDGSYIYVFKAITINHQICEGSGYVSLVR